MAAAVAVDLLVCGGDRSLRGGGASAWSVVPILTVAAHSTLVMRRGRPGAVFAVQCCFAMAGLVLPGFQPFAGLLVSLHTVARRAPLRWAVWALCLSAGPFLVDSYNTAHGVADQDAALAFAASASLWVALSATVWGLARRALTAQQQAESTRYLQAEEAVRDERLRLARELHDTIAHAVIAMLLQAAGARRLVPVDDEQVVRALDVIEGTGVQAMDELHRLLGVLRASGGRQEEVLVAAPSLREVPQLVALAREGGMAVRLVVDGDASPVDQHVDLTGYRVVQEALTNARKHAGNGASVEVRLSWGPTLVLSVQDAGGGTQTGLPELSSGLGLVGLAERVGLVGGRLETARTGRGFLVRADLPVLAGAPAPCRPAQAAAA